MSQAGDLNKRKIYVGNLPPDIRHRELDDLFYKYGKILDIDIKDRKKPPFAFIEFEDPRDAEDAVEEKDGFSFQGYRLRVEFPRSSNNDQSSGPKRSDEPKFNKFRNQGGTSKRSEHRVFVSGLPPTGSWQDLKDHMREAGDVGHADVFRDGTGVCEFLREEDMMYAIKNLDDSKFKSHEGEVSYIRVEYDKGKRPKSRSRSPVRTEKRSRTNGRQTPTYSPMRRSSPTYSRSRSRSDS